MNELEYAEHLLAVEACNMAYHKRRVAGDVSISREEFTNKYLHEFHQVKV